VVFVTPEDAIAAALLVNAIQQGRATRHEAALKTLGCTEDEASVEPGRPATAPPPAKAKGRADKKPSSEPAPAARVAMPARPPKSSTKRRKKARQTRTAPQKPASRGLKGTSESPFAALDALRAARRDAKKPGRSG
jgi:hypothetical protein